jgi:hypothetical protein
MSGTHISFLARSQTLLVDMEKGFPFQGVLALLLEALFAECLQLQRATSSFCTPPGTDYPQW